MKPTLRSLSSSRASSLESLEPRIAPAGLAITLDGKTATWTDVDGDLVTLKATKGVLDTTDFQFLPLVAGDLGQQLASLDLDDDGATANGVGLTFTAKRDTANKVGDGSVNIGRINAAGVDLGVVKIVGDLGALLAGDGNLSSGIKSLTISSAGAFGLDTQGDELDGDPTNLDWLVMGRLGKLLVKGDFFSSLTVEDGDGGFDFNPLAGTGAITIWGDLVGGDSTLTQFADEGSGYLLTEGPMGKVIIRGDIVGNADSFSGSVVSADDIASVTVGGNIYGGSASDTGLIFATGRLGKVVVYGSVLGGNSPFDETTGEIDVVSERTGAIGSSFKIDSVTIVSDLSAGEAQFSGAIFTSPDSGASIGAVTILGTLGGFTTLAVSDTDSVALTNGIYSDAQLGPVKVGAIFGEEPLSPAHIVAKGIATPANAREALAIASITVARGVTNAEILAGFDSDLFAVNPDVQIGAIKIGNNMIGSSISAGVTNDGFGFGDQNNVVAADTADTFDDPAIVSRIASLRVGSYISGNPAFDVDFVTGAVAQQIGSVKIGGATLELTPATDPAFSVGVTRSFFVREVA